MPDGATRRMKRHCPWCKELTKHWKVRHSSVPIMRRSRHYCTSCKENTLRCRNRLCDGMAKAGKWWDDEVCSYACGLATAGATTVAAAVFVFPVFPLAALTTGAVGGITGAFSGGVSYGRSSERHAPRPAAAQQQDEVPLQDSLDASSNQDPDQDPDQDTSEKSDTSGTSEKSDAKDTSEKSDMESMPAHTAADEPASPGAGDRF